MFVTTKHVLCPDKGMLSELPQVSFLSRQTCVCHHKTCPLSRQKFGVTLIYVATKHVLCHKYQKFCLDNFFFFYTTKVCLSRQNYKNILSRQTSFSRQNFYHDKHTFVATKDVFYCHSRQTRSLSRFFVCLLFCRDKNDTCGSSRQ